MRVILMDDGYTIFDEDVDKDTMKKKLQEMLEEFDVEVDDAV